MGRRRRCYDSTNGRQAKRARESRCDEWPRRSGAGHSGPNAARVQAGPRVEPAKRRSDGGRRTASPRSWWSDHWPARAPLSPRTPTRPPNMVGRVPAPDLPAGGADHAPDRRRLLACPRRRGRPRWHDRMRPGVVVRPRSPAAHRDRDPAQSGGATGASPGRSRRSPGAADATQAVAADVAPARAIPADRGAPSNRRVTTSWHHWPGVGPTGTMSQLRQGRTTRWTSRPAPGP